MASPIRRTGLTFIELLIALLMLAILAGVALPKYLGMADEVRASTTRGALNGVRAAVANFHANTAVSGDPRWPTLEELIGGEVLQDPIPINPYNERDSVRRTRWNPNDIPASGEYGWNYDPDFGKFWPDTRIVGEHAW